MPFFKYEVKDSKGQRKAGKAEADSKAELDQRLKEDGFRPLVIEEIPFEPDDPDSRAAARVQKLKFVYRLVLIFFVISPWVINSLMVDKEPEEPVRKKKRGPSDLDKSALTLATAQHQKTVELNHPDVRYFAVYINNIAIGCGEQSVIHCAKMLRSGHFDLCAKGVHDEDLKEFVENIERQIQETENGKRQLSAVIDAYVTQRSQGN